VDGFEFLYDRVWVYVDVCLLVLVDVMVGVVVELQFVFGLLVWFMVKVIEVDVYFVF